MQELELVLDKIVEFFQTPVVITSGVTLTVGTILLTIIKSLFPKSKLTKRLDDKDNEVKELVDRINELEQKNAELESQLKEQSEKANKAYSYSTNRNIKKLANPEMVKVKVISNATTSN